LLFKNSSGCAPSSSSQPLGKLQLRALRNPRLVFGRYLSGRGTPQIYHY
jgi:hypothetical protein